MEAETIIAYVITFVAIFFSLTALPQVIIGGLIGRISNPLIGSLAGGIIAWFLIDLLWLTFEGMHIPILALIVALGFILAHGFISKDELTKESNIMMAAEMWSIIIIGIYLVTKQDSIRWY